MWMLTTLTVMAEDPKFAGTEKPPAEEVVAPDAELSAEIGGTYATGNTVFYTVNGGAKGSYRFGDNKLSAMVGANIGKGVVDSSGDGKLDDTERATGLQPTAKRIEGEGRYDRFVGERVSLYVLAGALTDPFAGYDLRTHEQLGVSRGFVETEDTHFVGEIGIDDAQENYVDGVVPNSANIIAGRIMLELTQKLGESVMFGEKIEVYENLLDPADLRVLNDVSLTTQLSKILSLKVSNKIVFDNVPVEGFETLDTTSMVTLVAAIL